MGGGGDNTGRRGAAARVARNWPSRRAHAASRNESGGLAGSWGRQRQTTSEEEVAGRSRPGRIRWRWRGRRQIRRGRRDGRGPAARARQDGARTALAAGEDGTGARSGGSRGRRPAQTGVGQRRVEGRWLEAPARRESRPPRSAAARRSQSEPRSRGRGGC
jgi:hypothetical protein